MGKSTGKAVSPCCFGITGRREIVPRATPSGTGEPRVSSGLGVGGTNRARAALGVSTTRKDEMNDIKDGRCFLGQEA